MKKADREFGDMRPEYKRADFDKLVRGKYAARVSAGSNIVILEPAVAKAFPTDKAVNDALRILLEVEQATARLPRRSTRTTHARPPAVCRARARAST